MFDLKAGLFNIGAQPKRKFYVFYNNETGDLTDVVKSPTPEKLRQEHITVPIDDQLITDLLVSKISIRQLIVGFDRDTNKRQLFKRDTFLNRVYADSTELYYINKVTEPTLGTQLTVAIYDDNGIVEILINQETLDSFKGIVPNKNSIYDSFAHLQFFVVDSNDRVKLYATLNIDTAELIDKGSVKVHLPWYRKGMLAKLSVFTKRVFSTYQVASLDKYIATPHKVGNMSMQYESTADTNGHITLDLSKEVVTSNIIDPIKFNIFEDLVLHVVKNHDPNCYITSIRLTLDQLKNKQTQALPSLDDDITVVHDNPYIKINIRKKNESTNDRV